MSQRAQRGERLEKTAVPAVVKTNTNDTNMKNSTAEYLDALHSQGAEFILWSERHKPDNLGKLKAA